MKRPDDNIEKSFEQARHLGQGEMEEAGVRVLKRLRTQRDKSTPTAEPARPHVHQLWRLAAAASLVAALLILTVVIRNSSRSATMLAEAADSGLDGIAAGESIRVGQLLRTREGASLKLTDGSRVEMRAQAELSIERADDGLRIRLNNGDVIVNAARQHNGHLYVRTKDITVTVVGTVFLVNSEEAGSRVAVIEGEVRVEQGKTETTLRPGQEVSTNPILSGPVDAALSWSRNAGSHLALLQQTTVGTPRGNSTSSTGLRFDVISIRPSGPLAPGPGTLGPETESRGFGCHGVDGVSRAYGRAGLEIPIPQGRCVGNGATLIILMNFAYGTPWRFGSDIPNWAQHEEGGNSNQAYFKIEAAAENPDTTTIAQLKAMLQTMLADRFNVRLHRETQNVQAYVFHPAKNGARLKEATGDVELPRMVPGVGLHGVTSLDTLARFFTDFVVAFTNLGNIDYVFLNRTGLTGTYDYSFLLRPGGPGGGPRGGGNPNAGPPPREERLAQFASDLAASMEETVGIRVDAEKLPVEVIIVDHVERPSSN